MASLSVRPPNMFTMDTDADVWLLRFDSYLRLIRVSVDIDKINILFSFLDDKTFEVVHSLINEETYEGVKDRFRTLFCTPKLSLYVYLQMFVDRRQELSESVVSYAADLYDLGRKAFPSLKPIDLDAYIRGQFLAGLRNRDIADKLAALNIDMRALLIKAKEYEDRFICLNDFGHRNQNLFDNNNNVRTLITDSKRDSVTLKSESILFANIQQNRNHFLASKTTSLFIRDNNHNRVPNRRCYNCNQDGHLKRNCPFNNEYFKIENDSSSMEENYRRAPNRPDTNSYNEKSDKSDF